MGFLRSLLGRASRASNREESALILLGHVKDRGERPYGVEVVGEATYQDALWRVIGSRAQVDKRRHYVQAALMREPNNPYDKNAIAVYAKTPQAFERVSYIPRETANENQRDFVALERRGHSTGVCDGCIVGGFRSDDGATAHLGIWLNLGRPGKVLPSE